MRGSWRSKAAATVGAGVLLLAGCASEYGYEDEYGMGYEDGYEDEYEDDDGGSFVGGLLGGVISGIILLGGGHCHGHGKRH